MVVKNSGTKTDSTPLVFPGEVVSNALEYSPGKNTYENDEGDIVATGIGTISFNENAREVSVSAESKSLIRTGATVYGKVIMIRDALLIIEISHAEMAGKSLAVNDTRGVLMVSKISSRYIKNIREEFQMGDLVKAHVTDKSKFATDLATNAPDLGVIKAFCSNCKNPLHLNNHVLKCITCQRTESRCLSNEYLVK